LYIPAGMVHSVQNVATHPSAFLSITIDIDYNYTHAGLYHGILSYLTNGDRDVIFEMGANLLQRVWGEYVRVDDVGNYDEDGSYCRPFRGPHELPLRWLNLVHAAMDHMIYTSSRYAFLRPSERDEAMDERRGCARMALPSIGLSTRVDGSHIVADDIAPYLDAFYEILGDLDMSSKEYLDNQPLPTKAPSRPSLHSDGDDDSENVDDTEIDTIASDLYHYMIDEVAIQMGDERINVDDGDSITSEWQSTAICMNQKVLSMHHSGPVYNKIYRVTRHLLVDRWFAEAKHLTGRTFDKIIRFTEDPTITLPPCSQIIRQHHASPVASSLCHVLQEIATRSHDRVAEWRAEQLRFLRAHQHRYDEQQQRQLQRQQRRLRLKHSQQLQPSESMDDSSEESTSSMDIIGDDVVSDDLGQQEQSQQPHKSIEVKGREYEVPHSEL
jgi:hypothetical protein